MLQFRTLLLCHLHNRKARWRKNATVLFFYLQLAKHRKEYVAQKMFFDLLAQFIVSWIRTWSAFVTLDVLISEDVLPRLMNAAGMRRSWEGHDIGLLFQQQRLAHNRLLLKTYWFGSEFRTMPTPLWAPWSWYRSLRPVPNHPYYCNLQVFIQRFKKTYSLI